MTLKVPVTSAFTACLMKFRPPRPSVVPGIGRIDVVSVSKVYDDQGSGYFDATSGSDEVLTSKTQPFPWNSRCIAGINEVPVRKAHKRSRLWVLRWRQWV
ncbi:hypothetical protein BX666DRAFT_2033960 [Dichotomocladium elegans]|nr:hypothetical protein BX666DRAFT_2033960 [Dichotomocladium elegans]